MNERFTAISYIICYDRFKECSQNDKTNMVEVFMAAIFLGVSFEELVNMKLPPHTQQKIGL